LPNELQPVDINDVQAYLYKFKRPLSMAEINAIASETSKPILLGRKDDALAVSPTYIKNIQIESVMRKNAQFELRSNKLLP
jgi:type II restriction/modification system DNA methylase subunit YeeA